MKTPPFLCLLILPFFSCKKEKDTLTANKKFSPLPTIEVSSSPIWMNISCTHNYLDAYVSTNSPDNVVFELDGQTLTAVNIEFDSYQHFLLDLPSTKHFNQLSICLIAGENAPEALQIPIKYYEHGDTLAFFSAERNVVKSIYCLARDCWNGYKGDTLLNDTDYFIEAESQMEDKVVGDTITRTLKLKDVFLVEDITNYRVAVKPDLQYSYSTKNYAGWPSHTTTPLSQGVVRLGIRSIKNHNYPSYSLWGRRFGRQWLLKAKDCGNFDTLQMSNFILPEFYQVELNCPIKAD